MNADDEQMTTPLKRIGKGRYSHERLGVEIEKTLTPNHPWELSGTDEQCSRVVLARTLGDARAFLHGVEKHVDRDGDRRLIALREGSLEQLALGHAVRFEREQRDITAAELALALGIEIERIKALEAGRIGPDYVMLARLARALGIRMGELIKRAGRLAVGDQEPGPERASGQDAKDALLKVHRYLYPERYEDVPTHTWDQNTILEVASLIERSLSDDPRAKL